MTMADTVAVMNRGHIEQLGAPEELYDLPRTRFVANFLGQANTGAGTIKDVDGDHLVVNVLGTPVKILKSRSQVHEGEVLFGVRPEKVTVSRRQPEGAGNDVRGVVRDVSFLGVATSYPADALQADRVVPDISHVTLPLLDALAAGSNGHPEEGR